MKKWKKKYLALLLTVALGTAMMAFSACDEGIVGGGTQGGQSSQSSQNGNPSLGTSSSVSDSSLDDGNSASSNLGGGSQQKPSDKDSSGGGSQVTPDDKDSSGGGQEKPQTTVSMTQWENALTPTNYTACGEMWSENSTSPTLNVKRAGNMFYMVAGAEEYIVETGATNVYYVWSDSDKEWKQDNTSPSQQHLIPEQMLVMLQGKYSAFTYDEEKELYEARNITLPMMGKEMNFEMATVAFENGNVSVMYCEVQKNGMRFTFSQYGVTRVEFTDKDSVGGGTGTSASSSTNSGGMGVTTEFPDDDHGDHDDRNEAMTLAEWTKMLSVTTYKAHVSSLDTDFTLSRDDNLYYLEMKDVTGAKGRIEYYFEVTDAATYIYVRDEQTRAWTKEEYDEEWEEEVGSYEGIDIILQEFLNSYDAFEFHGDIAEAKEITCWGSEVQRISLQIMNDTLKNVEIRVSDEEGMISIFFHGTVSISLPIK